ncbi:hypothetical protein WAZ07_03905 [Bacillus sp. FJAT-51639]|uniref:Nuclear transport factor 2 family protein n=1 Tax=Bacillus bruguierae TaxID=3127667 RepID=A0ABU8FCS6_9BACI
MKRIVSFGIVGICLLCYETEISAASPNQIVQKELEYISNHKPVLYSKLWMRSMQTSVLFHHNDRIHHQDTLHNIKHSSLVDIKQMSLTKAAVYMPRVAQYVSKFGKENVQVYYLAVQYDVKKENTYQMNGTNYFLQAFVREYGDWKIAESIVAPTGQIVTNGDGFGTDEEKDYSEKRNNVK